MKKLILLILVCSLALLTFVGCSGSTTSNNSTQNSTTPNVFTPPETTPEVSTPLETTPSHEHIWGTDVTEITPSSCTESGVGTVVCECGESKAVSIDPACKRFFGGKCTVCGKIPIVATPSIFDYDNNGETDTFYFTPILPEKFTREDVIHFDCEDTLSPKGSYLLHTATFHEPELYNFFSFVYCYDSDDYLLYEIIVPEAGIYDVAIHTCIQDPDEHGAKYIINEGAEYETAFEISYRFESKEQVAQARFDIMFESSYMFGFQIELVEGKNTIKIMKSESIKYSKTFRDIFLVKAE